MIGAMKRLDVAAVSGALEVVEHAATRPRRPFATELVDLMRQLLRADHGCYIEFRLDAPCSMLYELDVPFVDYAAVDAAIAALDCFHPHRLVPSHEHDHALTLDDLWRPSQKRRDPFYNEVLRPLSIEHEIRIYLGAAAGAGRVFTFDRAAGSSNFGERERNVLQLLRPHLTRIRNAAQHAAVPNAAVSSVLTPREIQVMQLVRDGYLNKQIASTLGLSPHTVRTHLQQVFAKLDVQNRTSAVAQVFGA